MSPFIFSRKCEPRQSFFPNHPNQQPTNVVCTYPQPKGQVPHRRVKSEPLNDHYRHKLLPRLPHEIDPYRSRSLPELPSETSKFNNRPQSKYAPEIPTYKNKPLPSLPLQTCEHAEREISTVGMNSTIDSESFLQTWSKCLLLKCENVESWEEKLSLARETQDCWAKGKSFAHEVQDCAYNCACGMI